MLISKSKEVLIAFAILTVSYVGEISCTQSDTPSDYNVTQSASNLEDANKK